MNDLCCAGEDSRRCVTVATMAKKISKSDGNRGMNSKGQTVSFGGKKVTFPAKPQMKPTEAITAKGGTAKGLAKSTKQNRFASTAKTPVKKEGQGFAGSGGPLHTGFPKQTPSRIAKAAAVAIGGAAASTAKIGTRYVVSEATKKLQRELSKELKQRSNKDIRSLPKREREEIAFGRSMQFEVPEEYMEDMAYPGQLREQISNMMKKTTKTKKTITSEKLGSAGKRSGRSGAKKK